jgi:hypothetical protein
MDIEGFRSSLAETGPPEGCDAALAALWWDARGDWNRAHDHAQAEDTPRAAWAHAYLHRKEGDLGNAAYWYRRAGRPVATGALEGEWAAMAETLLQEA